MPAKIITIDGPAGAGKSTVAKQVAKRLGYLYIDTGAMYRAVTWMCIKKSVDISDESEVESIAENYPVDLIPADNKQGYRVVIDNTDITDSITSDAVNANVSPVARISAVRKILVTRQQEMAAGGGVVMAGRDITTVVMPDAELKIYLDASIAERAKRRLEELHRDGRDAFLESVMDNLRDRDKIDSEREDSPLMVSPDAIILDTTGMGINEVVDKVIKMVDDYVG